MTHILKNRDLWAFLERNGISRSDIVTVHGSLRRLGPVEGGADGLIDAMKDYLAEGLLVIPTHTWASVNRRQPVFDVRKTIPCIGTLAAVAAFRPDGVRSLHPTHSAAAFGKGAAAFMAGEELCGTPAPPTCWLGRLRSEGGKILLIGVGHDKNTYLHMVDELMELPDRLSDNPFQPVIIGHNGEHVFSPLYRGHHCSYTNDVSARYPNYTKALLTTGAAHNDVLGGASVCICDARKTADTVMALWQRSDHDLCRDFEPVPEEYYLDFTRSGSPPSSPATP